MSALEQYHAPRVQPKHRKSQLMHANEKLRPAIFWQTGIIAASGIALALAAYTGIPVVQNVLHAVWPSISQLAIAVPAAVIGFAAAGYSLILRKGICDAIEPLRRGPEDTPEDHILRESAKKHLGRLTLASFTAAAAGTLSALSFRNGVDLQLLVASTIICAPAVYFSETSERKLVARLVPFRVPII